MHQVLPGNSVLGLWIVSLLFCSVIGCSEKRWSAIPVDAAQQIKSGTTLSEINQKLGEPHEPTPAQTKAIEGTIERMPPQVQANARKHRHLAWGTDETFFVAVVNEEDVAWAVSWHSHSVDN